MTSLYKREKIEETPSGIPIFGLKEDKTGDVEFTQDRYRVRVEKFVLGDDDENCIQLEAILNRALLSPAAGQPDVILLDRKESFFEGIFFVVLTYMERRP